MQDQQFGLGSAVGSSAGLDLVHLCGSLQLAAAPKMSGMKWSYLLVWRLIMAAGWVVTPAIEPRLFHKVTVLGES